MPQASIAQTMSVPGSLSVGATGAATYNTPIAVPPGTAGLAPSLSLEYNSQGANGIVGVGWSLSGLLSIGRCPQTFAQDGVRGGINYDGNDRFCLDGQRLVAISGTYGADGTEYRTEVESFSRVISHGAAGTGPAWFEVHTKSGQVMEFGHTTDSLVLALGKSTARNWAVNKVSDTKGNYFTVTYTNDTTNGQAYPIEIDYTGNAAANLSPYNKVQFIYATRPDVSSAYQAGSLIQTTVRLTDVQTYAGASLVADYKLTYAQGSGTSRSQLASVALCDGTGNCLPATTFNWQNGVTGTTSVVANVGGQDGQLTGYVPFVADFNGDGLPDIMWDAEVSGGKVSSGTRVLWTNTGAGTFSVNTNFAGQNGTLSGYFPYIADYNRDGRADILWAQSSNGSLTGSTTRWTSNNAGTVVVTPGPALPAVGTKSVIAVADIDGDGRADLQIYEGSSGTLNSFLTASTGALTRVSQASSSINLSCPPAGLSTADFDGDGRLDDLLQAASTGFSGNCLGTNGVQQISFGNGDGTFRTVAGSDNSVATYAPTYLDLNGDGKSDVLWGTFDSNGRSNGSSIIWISKGDGTFAVVANPGGTDGTLTGYVAYPGDFNGDGKADILWVQTDTNGLSTGTRVLWVGKGDGTFTVVSNFAGQDGQIVGYVPILADFNGDGKTDVLWDKRVAGDNRSQGTRVLWLSDGVVPDVMSGVTSGLGATTTVTYQPLSNSSVYTKDNTAIDPIVDVQGNILVVSRVDTVDGVGGTKSATYSYAGAKVDVSGRGFLGFRQIVATDLPTNIALTTTYRQDFPYIALVASTTTALGASTLNQTTNSYQFSNASGASTLSVPSATSAPYRVSVSQTASSSSDLDGSAIPSSTINYQYDAYGNSTQVVASASDGYSKTTTNTYTNDTTKWLLGRLTASTVTSQAPQQLGQYCALPWGGTITNGQSVTAYSAANPPVGQACSAPQTRTCTNGTLSGSYAQQSCAALCALPWGGTISQGQSVTAYSAAAVPAPQVCTSIAETRTCGATGVLSGSNTFQSCVVRQPKTVFLTSGTSWTVPADWNNSANSVQCIGGGGNGGSGVGGTGGGGGGAYAKSVNLTLSGTVPIQVGGAGQDTWFNSAAFPSSGQACGAKGGSVGVGNAGGVGGSATASYATGTGSIKNSGGHGGAQGGNGAIGSTGSGGGGAAGGPNGVGAAGGGGSTSGTRSGGGGGSNGGSIGGSGGSGGSGAGGNGFSGTGGGAAGATGIPAGNGTAGTGGGGGGNGASGVSGGNGGTGNILGNSSGPGGGGGGSGGSGGNGGAGALYGGGGGNGSLSGGAGAQGVIVITYTPNS